MNRRSKTLSGLAVAATIAVAASAHGAAVAPSGRVVVVADAALPAAAVQEALRDAGPGAALRLPRTQTEQLSVTRWFAARGYDIVAIGLSTRVAVDPVQRRYPRVRFSVRG
jgi:hypothetical protein